MKNIIYLFLVLTIVSCNNKNSEKKLLTDSEVIEETAKNQDYDFISDIQAIAMHTSKNEMDKVLSYTYPKFFEVVPREMALGGLSMISQMGIKMMYEEVPIEGKVSKIVNTKDGQMIVATYKNSMLMEFENEMMCNAFTSIPQPDFVFEKISPLKARMKGNAYVLGLNDSNTKGAWKYLNLEQETEAIIKQIVTKEVFDFIPQLKSNL